MSTTSVNSIHDLLLSKCNGQTVPDGEVEANLKPAKILKLSEEDQLKFVRILNEGTKSKRIVLECRFQDKPAVVILEKTQFDAEVTEKLVEQFCSLFENGTNLFRNDIFGSYLLDIDSGTKRLSTEKIDQSDWSKLCRLFVSVVHPATPKDIEKYTDQERFLITETYELYQEVTKPYIDKLVSDPGHLKWLYNVLEHKAEVDRIIYEECDDLETGFILAKDMKWKYDENSSLTDQERSELYLNALVLRRDIHSLRDLHAKHLPLLMRIQDRCPAAITNRYHVPCSQLRVFIHYQPSFYHLHVHFTHLKAEHGGFQCERSQLLSTVIENIRLMPDYYQRATLHFPLSSISQLKPEHYTEPKSE